MHCVIEELTNTLLQIIFFTFLIVIGYLKFEEGKKLYSENSNTFMTYKLLQSKQLWNQVDLIPFAISSNYYKNRFIWLENPIKKFQFW
jgi:hypothetical protein